MTKSSFLKRKQWIVLLVVAALLPSLSGCAPLVLGGAALGAVMAADRRTAGAQLDDQRIEFRAGQIIRGNNQLSKGHISVTSYNRWALLTGEVPSEAVKQLATQAVSGIENVQRVINELSVEPNASWSQIGSDAILTSRIKATLVNTKDLYATSFIITSERGIVYIMGRVTEKEAVLATNIISQIDGVHKVVRALQIVTKQDLLHMVTAQPDAPAQLAPSSAPI